MRLRLFVAAAAILSGCAAAHADTYLYTVSFDDSPYTSVATFTSPDIITETTDVPATGQSDFAGNVTDVALCPALGGCPYNNSPDAFFGTGLAAGEDTLLFSTDVESVGTFTDVGGHGTVTITDLGPSSVTPEPSSIVLLGTGLLGVAGIVRKRFV